MSLYSSFNFSLNNRACQQLAKLLLLWRREEVEGIEWGPVVQAVLGTDNAISTLERGDRAFVPFSFPWFQYLLTIRNSLSHEGTSSIDDASFSSATGLLYAAIISGRHLLL